MAKKKKKKAAPLNQDPILQLKRDVKLHKKILINLTSAINSISSKVGMKMKLSDGFKNRNA
ncbi:MAG: hypothetical protein K8U03_09095 [Planctomycetia bacterium]|nr:hypothetical protein [Planctomycetia bacterium]